MTTDLAEGRNDGIRTATALVTTLVGMSVPFAAVLGFANHPVAAVGGGLFAVGGVLAVRAMDRNPGALAAAGETVGYGLELGRQQGHADDELTTLWRAGVRSRTSGSSS